MHSVDDTAACTRPRFQAVTTSVARATRSSAAASATCESDALGRADFYSEAQRTLGPVPKRTSRRIREPQMAKWPIDIRRCQSGRRAPRQRPQPRHERLVLHLREERDVGRLDVGQGALQALPPGRP